VTRLVRDYRMVEKSPLPSSEKAVLYGLLMHKDGEHDVAFPSRDRLARGTGLSARTISRSLRSLEERKIIETSRREGSRANLYRIDLDHLPPCVSAFRAGTVVGYRLAWRVDHGTPSGGLPLTDELPDAVDLFTVKRGWVGTPQVRNAFLYAVRGRTYSIGRWPGESFEVLMEVASRSAWFNDGGTAAERAHQHPWYGYRMCALRLSFEIRSVRWALPDENVAGTPVGR
jgi:DNA-binding transcriptional ArsR family regulator